MIITKDNYRRFVFAIIFIAINIIILPFRIKSGFDLQQSGSSNDIDNVNVPSSNSKISAPSVYTDSNDIDINTDVPSFNSIKISAPSVYTDTYNPQHVKENNIRISYRLHDPNDEPRPDKFLSVDTFFCKDRADLPPSLESTNEGKLFDFTTTVSTNLNILWMGDSLGHQFSQGWEAAVLGKGHESNRKVHMKYNVGSKQFDCLASSAPVRGGGVSAFWRYTKLLERSRWTKIAPCFVMERKWGENFLHTLLDLKYTDPGTSQQQYSVNGLDAVVIRLPHGWMKAEELTKERIKEVIIFCQELVGARAVIFTTVGLDNNAITADMWKGVVKINQLIHEVANEWQPPKDGQDGVQYVLVQEFSDFTSKILHENGKHIGYNTTSNNFFFERLVGGSTSWPQSIPMVCANKPKDNLDSECQRNKISPDGIHWCVETLGPRFTASIACLLGCVYNKKPPESSPEGLASVRKCEKDCNDQFMSLKRVADNWIGNEKTLYASSNSNA